MALLRVNTVTKKYYKLHAMVWISYTHIPIHLYSFRFLDNGDKQTIREAAGVIAKHTCIRFVERTNQPDYIEFYEDSK